MRAAETRAARCRAPSRFRRRGYRSLAYAIAATRPPAGLVFESTLAEPWPRITARPGSIFDTARADPASAAVPFEEIPVPDAPEPPAGWADRSFVVVPLSVPGQWPWRRPTVAGSRGAATRLLGLHGWVAFQTFWVRRPTGEIAVSRRGRLAAPTTDQLARLDASISAGIAGEWADATGVPAAVRPLGACSRRAWERGSIHGLPRDAWLVRSPETVADTAEIRAIGSGADETTSEHTVVFGASGAGKTTYLAHRAGSAIRRGERVVAIDVHGDLTPAIVERVPVADRARLIAVDATQRPVPGIAALVHGSLEEERAAAHLVATLKRLTPDGTDLYWGFRLERIFDTFVRLVLESGGSILDLYGLLTDPRRREAARWATRREDLATFLDELAPVVRRNPEFLWSAATRLSKIVLVPALGELLAPPGGGLPLESLIESGRSVLVRLPIAELGPEASTFAAALVLGRVYLGLVARSTRSGSVPLVHLVLDEVHGFPPRLLAEILTEGRKFGVRAVIATQYPERLAPETRSAAAGALTGCLAFRVPRPTSAEVGAWLGLPPGEAAELLPNLPVGRALGVEGDAGEVVVLPPIPDPSAAPGPGAWQQTVDRTRAEFPATPGPSGGPEMDDTTTDRLLLATLGAEEEGRSVASGELVRSACDDPADLARVADHWRTVLRRGWATESDTGCRITPAGERLLGLAVPTGAVRETSEHRALLIRAFRIFARHGGRLEIVRQGRFDTTLPDARFRQLPPSAPGAPPIELAVALDRARLTWAWRYFGGRDVEVEAEVSGALRPDRIRRGWRKAEARGAFALFLVGNAERARRIRSTLRRIGVGPDRARVWTLPVGPVPVPPGRPTNP